MGKFLHNSGTFLFSKKWWVVGFWVIVLAIVGTGATLFYKAGSSGVTIPGTPAQVTIDRVAQLLPGGGGGTAQIVFHSLDSSKVITDFQGVIDPALAQVKTVPGVTNVVSPFVNPQAVSADGKTAYAVIQLTQGFGSVEKVTVDGIAGITKSLSSSQLEVERTSSIVTTVPSEFFGLSEATGIIIALAVLFMTFGALISAGMPLLIAILGIGISIAGVFSLSHLIDVSATTPILSAMLGLAVGIDYSLFIISKYRSYLLEGYSYKEAAGRAIGTAGTAVVFAAATVIIALAALSVVNIPFMTTMGLAGAASIAVAAFLAITLTPAIFGIAGTRIFSRKTAAKIAEAQEHGPAGQHTVNQKTFWYRWIQVIIKQPVAVIVLCVIVVGLMAYPVTSLTLGLPNDEYAAPDSTQRHAYDLLANGFGVGFNAPLVVLVENVPPVTDADKAAVRAQLMAAFQKQIADGTAAQTAKFQQQAAAATTPELKAKLQQDIADAQANGPKQLAAAQAQLETAIAQYSNLAELGKIGQQFAKIPDVAVATPALVTADGKAGLIQIIPASAPSDQKTSDLISYIRNNPAQASGSADYKLGVTGYTALQDDINKKLADALPVYLAVVVGLSLILLLIAFRSILVPLKATLGFLLSVLAMFGATVAVFQWGWFGIASPAPIISFIPIIGTGILFGLAMDYEFFLVSSMHEVYSRTKNAREGVASGFSLGAKVVTAAAAIMVAVFAGFAGNADSNIKVFGVSLGVGIFVDAFIVRMTLVPAIMSLFGKAMWWIPGWLDKALPHVSIEGEVEENETFVEVSEPSLAQSKVDASPVK